MRSKNNTVIPIILSRTSYIHLAPSPPTFPSILVRSNLNESRKSTENFPFFLGYTGGQLFVLSNMSLSISSRLKLPKKIELMKSQSQAQLLANKLRNDGVMNTGNCFTVLPQLSTLILLLYCFL